MILGALGNRLSLGLVGPAGVAATVLALAAVALVVLAEGEAGGWLPHGVRPAAWPLVSWIALFLSGWVLMTGAMMLPASIPFFDSVARVGGGSLAALAGIAFACVWLAVGILLCAAFWAGGGLLAGLAPGRAEQLAGISLIFAGVYQASPLAARCQRACARPFAIIARRWRGARPRREAAAAGLDHGLACVGCCLPLVVVMLLVGLHDVFWTLVLAGLMAAQKNFPVALRMAPLLAVILVSAGLAIMIGIWRPPLEGLRTLCGA